MEEKKIIISLQEWDEMQQEVARLRNQLNIEREMFKGKAQCVLLEAAMAKLGLCLYRNIPLAVYTNNTEVFKSIDSLRKLIDENFDYKAELRRVKSMSVWEFLMMKLFKEEQDETKQAAERNMRTDKVAGILLDEQQRY